MREVLYISYDANPTSNGAPTTHTREVALAIAAEGTNVHVVSSGMGADSFKSKNISWDCANTLPLHGSIIRVIWRILINNLKIVKTAWRYRHSNVIYERHNSNSLAGIILSLISSRPLVFEVNGIPGEEAIEAQNIQNEIVKKAIRTLTTFELKRAAATIVQTAELSEIIASTYHINNIKVIHNGATPTDLNAIKSTGITKFVYVGAIDTFHNVEFILDTFVQIKDIPYELTVVGSGDSLNNLKRRFSNDKRITFMGNVAHEQALAIIRSSDVGVAQYSITTGLFKKYGFYFCPLKLLEYLAAGKPSIVYATENSFVKELVSANVCLASNTVEEFSNHIRELATSRTLRSQMTQNAKTVREQYTWATSARQTLEVFSEVVG